MFYINDIEKEVLGIKYVCEEIIDSLFLYNNREVYIWLWWVVRNGKLISN